MENRSNHIQVPLTDFIHGEASSSYLKLVSSAYEDLEKNPTGESQFFWNFLKSLNLRVNQRFFDDFQFNDGFQIVDQAGRLTYFSLNIARLLRFDIEHVLKTPFDQLCSAFLLIRLLTQ